MAKAKSSSRSTGGSQPKAREQPAEYMRLYRDRILVDPKARLRLKLKMLKDEEVKHLEELADKWIAARASNTR